MLPPLVDEVSFPDVELVVGLNVVEVVVAFEVVVVALEVVVPAVVEIETTTTVPFIPEAQWGVHLYLKSPV